MIVGITGNPHAGKTLFLTLIALDALDNNLQVFANYHINYKARNGNVAQFVDLGKLALWLQKEGRSLVADSGIMLLDEAYKGMDSYRSRSNANLILSYFMLQARHYGFRDIYYDAQAFSSVHKRVRINTDIGVRAWKTTEAHGKEVVPHFRYIVQNFEDASITQLDVDYVLAQEIWKWYDTHEKIKAPSIALDPKLAKRMIQELGKEELKAWSHEKGGGDVNPKRVKLV